MKKITIFLFACSVIATSCEDNEISPTIDNFKLLKILNYSNSSASQPYGTVEFSYDTRGNLIKESVIDYPNTLTAYRVYEYSDKQRIKKKIYDGQVGNLSLGSYTNYYYTENKLTREELFLSNGSLKHETFYEFDEDRLVNTYKVDDELGVHHQYKYLFDEMNQLILEEVFMYNQEISASTKYFYDNLNRQIKREFYNHEGVLTSYILQVYEGASEFPNEENIFDSNDSLTQTRQLNYDNWRNLTEIDIIGQGTTCKLFKRQYDGQLLTEEIRYLASFGCSEWTVTRYEYGTK